jgi:hypothetical protein
MFSLWGNCNVTADKRNTKPKHINDKFFNEVPMTVTLVVEAFALVGCYVGNQLPTSRA